MTQDNETGHRELTKEEQARKRELTKEIRDYLKEPDNPETPLGYDEVDAYYMLKTLRGMSPRESDPKQLELWRPITLGDSFDRALALASELQRDPKGESTEVPHISHLMSVAALVLEDGGDEEEAIAGLLHDALADYADQISGEDLEERFGPRVRELVEACTFPWPDYEGSRKPTWEARREAYTEHIARGEMPPRVSLADKVHNVRCLLRDHRLGEAVWHRFSATKCETLWHYHDLVAAYRAAGADGFLLEELERTLDEIETTASPTEAIDP